MARTQCVVHFLIIHLPLISYAIQGNAHTMIINEETGIAYVAGTDTCKGGLHMIDVGTPSDPKFLGCFQRDGYTHDLQCMYACIVESVL